MDRDTDPKPQTVPLDEPAKADADETPIGPALPEDAHVRPGSPLSDPARELQLEFEEQQEANEVLP
ncbi:MAG: hypothetical protein U0797_04025 [Gemmataceae bacterium]